MSWSAIVLAGGIGSRLLPLTSELPKPMVPVANKPMIEFNLELLRNAGIKGKIVIVTKYLQNKIREYIDESTSFSDLDIVLPKIDPLDTADAVRKTANFIDTDYFIVSMADIVTNLPLNDFMAFHQEKKSIASITLKDMPHPRAFGVIMLNQNSRILLFLEKPLPQELGLATLTFAKKETIRLQSNLVNTGVYAFNNEILEILNSMSDMMDFGKHVFPYIIREYGIYGYERKDYYWMDAGNPETYLYTNWDVLRRWSFPYFPRATWEDNGIWWNGSKPDIHPQSSLKKPISFGFNVHIGINTKIGPLTVIGDNVEIGDNTVIESSVVWNDVKIGDNVTIKESIICNNVNIPNSSQLQPRTIIAPYKSFESTLKTSKGQIIDRNEKL